MKREEVLRILREWWVDIREQYGVKSLALFGSVARDEGRPDSDIDLLVEFERPIGLFDFISLQQQLESLLGCKVDLGTPRSLKPYLKERVLEDAIYVA